MKLYQDPHAPNPRRVRIFAAEKGIELSLAPVSINDSEHLSDDFLQIHPLGLLPVLELDDGRRLRESMAIIHYFEGIKPEPNLLGSDPYETASIEQWNRHMEFEILVPIREVFRNTHSFWKGRIDQAPQFGEISLSILRRRLHWLESELGSRDYIAGDRFTVADITALCALDFGRISKIRLDPETQPNLTAWYQRVTSRDSSKA